MTDAPHLLDGSIKSERRETKSIAIVDDDAELCSLFFLLVKSLGYNPTFVGNDGADIVRAMLEDGSLRPNIVLMDYRMPKMNGLDAAKGILKISPGTKIIIASADDTVKKESVGAGLFFIQKPFSGKMLANALNDISNPDQ